MPWRSWASELDIFLLLREHCRPHWDGVTNGDVKCLKGVQPETEFGKWRWEKAAGRVPWWWELVSGPLLLSWSPAAFLQVLFQRPVHGLSLYIVQPFPVFPRPYSASVVLALSLFPSHLSAGPLLTLCFPSNLSKPVLVTPLLSQMFPMTF